MRDLTIAIVNYRTGGLTVDCLGSIMTDPTLPPNTRIMVVDAASGDGSSEQIAAAIVSNAWQPSIALADLPRNGGFAYGNNRAIEAADERWGRAQNYLLLNPDTLVRPGAIGPLVLFLRQNENVGIVGSLLEDPDGTQQACSFRFPTALSELESEARLGPITHLLRRWRVVLQVGRAPHRAEWVSGASMMVRRDVFDQIGWLDEDYFLYYEELDFCRRAAYQGFQCWTVPHSRVVHLCGQATGVSAKDGPAKRRPAYWFQSRNRYFEKHHGPWSHAAADLAWICGQAVWKTRQTLTRRANVDPPFLFRDFVANRMQRAGK